MKLTVLTSNMVNLKEISEKEYEECRKGLIDPQIFHRKFYVLLKCFQVSESPSPKWALLSKILMAVFAVTAQTILSLSIYHGIDTLNLSFITEACNYFIVMSYELLILFCTIQNVSCYHSLQRHLREDFLYACKKGGKYRKKFFCNQIQTRKICKLAIIFTAGIAVAMILIATFALIYFLITHNRGEGKRPLLFPFWAFETDFGASPTYEIAFMFANLCIVGYAFNYVFMVFTQIMWIREIASKADIINMCIQDLMDGIHTAQDDTARQYFDILIKHRMKEIVQLHQSMLTLVENHAKVYKKLLLFEQKVSAPVVCLSAYTVTEKLEAGELNAILIVLCIGAITLLFISCYLCTYISIKVNSICFSCWDIPFWDAGPVIRPYLVLIMQRSLRPLPLKAPGFEEVSIQTFSKKMASAYSYFNMLRQVNK